MATNGSQKPSRRDSVINSPEEAVEMVRQFQSTVTAFSSEPAYRNLAEVVDRIPQLEADLRERVKTSKLADETYERERVSHKNELRKSLDLYQEKYDQFRKVEAGFQKRIADLNGLLAEKDKSIVGLEKTETDLKAAGREVKETYKTTKNKLKETELQVAQLKKSSQDDQAKIESLSTTLRKHQTDNATLTKALVETRQNSTQIEKTLNATKLSLDEIRSYSVPLNNVDINKLLVSREFEIGITTNHRSERTRFSRYGCL